MARERLGKGSGRSPSMTHSPASFDLWWNLAVADPGTAVRPKPSLRDGQLAVQVSRPDVCHNLGIPRHQSRHVQARWKPDTATGAALCDLILVLVLLFSLVQAAQQGCLRSLLPSTERQFCHHGALNCADDLTLFCVCTAMHTLACDQREKK